MKTINNALIRSFSPCYDPSEKGIPDNETLPILDWIEKYRRVVPDEDIFWLLLRNEFLSDKDLRLFAVWCARESLKLVDNPDSRSVEACNVAERYANSEATKEELYSAWKAAEEATWEAAGKTAWVTWEAAGKAERAAALEGAEEVALATAGEWAQKKQLEYLIENCIKKL